MRYGRRPIVRSTPWRNGPEPGEPPPGHRHRRRRRASGDRLDRRRRRARARPGSAAGCSRTSCGSSISRAPRSSCRPRRATRGTPTASSTASEDNEPWVGNALATIGAAVALAEDGGVPVERVALAGFSQGACLVAEMLAREPRPYAARRDPHGRPVRDRGRAARAAASLRRHARPRHRSRRRQLGARAARASGRLSCCGRPTRRWSSRSMMIRSTRSTMMRSPPCDGCSSGRRGLSRGIEGVR